MGIFDNDVDVFTTYETELKIRDRLVGGTPRDPKIIEAWLRKTTGIEDKQELAVMTSRTLMESGVEMPEGMDSEEHLRQMDSVQLYNFMSGVSERYADQKHTVGFKRDDVGGLFIEDRQIKAMIKEVTNILYAGKRWGPTKKGPKSFVAERVFVNPARIYIGRDEPDDVETFVGHTSGPQGRQSNLTRIEVAHQPTLRFTIQVVGDSVEFEDWKAMWVLAQENGLGALRSQSHGRFDLTKFDRVA